MTEAARGKHHIGDFLPTEEAIQVVAPKAVDNDQSEYQLHPRPEENKGSDCTLSALLARANEALFGQVFKCSQKWDGKKGKASALNLRGSRHPLISSCLLFGLTTNTCT